MLELTNLTKHYDDVVALDGVSLTARPGRLLGFLGPNGAGKTTTMRVVFGLVRPETGTRRWKGEPISDEALLNFGYMPEQRGLYPRMPIAAQLVYLARLHGLTTTEARDAAHTWLERFELGDRAADPLSALSHGNQQRVQLAAALVHDPELLVLDEPFNGLDPLGVASMSTILRERAAAGTTVVFSSHQLDLVEDLCDDVTIIARGRDRLTGTVDEVRDAAGVRVVGVRLAGGAPATPPPDATRIEQTADGRTVFQVPSDRPAAAVLADLTSGGAAIEHFAFTPPPLSRVFRDVVLESLAAMSEAAS